MIDAREVEALSGWHVLARRVVASTNDEASLLRASGAQDRTVVVADRQTAGRGRGGHRFASPPGGLYASLLLRVRPADLPAPLVAAAAVALAEAIEAVGVPAARVKWPNDVWIGDRKVAGLLAEADPTGTRAGPDRVSVILGVGVNVERVPSDLPADVAAGVTAVDLHVPAPVRPELLLAAFLRGLDRRLTALDEPLRRAELETAYRSRMALVHERVRFLVGDASRVGVLEDVSLERGLLVQGPSGPPSWHAAAHVRELRPEGP